MRRSRIDRRASQSRRQAAAEYGYCLSPAPRQHDPRRGAEGCPVVARPRGPAPPGEEARIRRTREVTTTRASQSQCISGYMFLEQFGAHCPWRGRSRRHIFHIRPASAVSRSTLRGVCRVRIRRALSAYPDDPLVYSTAGPRWADHAVGEARHAQSPNAKACAVLGAPLKSHTRRQTVVLGESHTFGPVSSMPRELVTAAVMRST